MNPVLVWLIIIAAFLLWLLCSALYIPIGKLINRLFSDAREAMMEEEEKEREEKEE